MSRLTEADADMAQETERAALLQEAQLLIQKVVWGEANAQWVTSAREWLEKLSNQQSGMKPAQPRTVLDIMDEARKTYTERTAVYQRGDRILGRICAEMWPGGLTLRTPQEFTRFYLFAGQIVAKALRYAVNFATGGHPDSAHDMGVYSFMLEAEDAARDHNGE